MDVKKVLQSYDRLVREVQVLEHQQELCRRMRYGLPPPEGRCRLLLEDVIRVRSLLIEAYISWAEGTKPAARSAGCRQAEESREASGTSALRARSSATLSLRNAQWLEISQSALYKKLTGERRLRPEEKDVLTRMAKRVKAGMEVE